MLERGNDQSCTLEGLSNQVDEGVNSDASPEAERDVRADTESVRVERAQQASQRAQQLSRFHGHICQRVTARARQQQLEAARSAKRLSDKCARLVLPATKALSESDDRGRSQGANQSGAPHPAARRARVADGFKAQAAAMDEGCMLFIETAKVLEREAQLRELLLQSTGTRPSSRTPAYLDGFAGDSAGYGSDQEAGTVSPEQYMAAERARVKGAAAREGHKTPATAPRAAAAVGVPKRLPTAREAGSDSERSGRWRVRSIDVSSGSEVRVYRHVPTSSTPWRSKTANASAHPTPSRRQEQSRFLDALQMQVGGPALCSCSSRASVERWPEADRRPGFPPPRSARRPGACANNCALYKQPKKREKLLAVVCEQRQ